MTERFVSDVDIDFGDRSLIIKHLRVTPALMKSGDVLRKHASGVYPTDIPYDPVNDTASIDYIEAEARGYVKLDFLNINLYSYVKDEAHLVKLMMEPDWSLLLDKDFCERLVQIGNYHKTITELSEPIDSLPRLAMFVALIRPGKKHLMGKTWKEISESIWNKDDVGYSFKKSHAVAYAQLIVVNMNLLVENPDLRI
jgi:hypothetical protein